jgi:hypothetical protein
VEYQELPVLLLGELQRQRRMNKAQSARIDELKARIEELATRVGR